MVFVLVLIWAPINFDFLFLFFAAAPYVEIMGMSVDTFVFVLQFVHFGTQIYLKCLIKDK